MIEIKKNTAKDNAKEIIDQVKACKKRTGALRERMDDDFKLLIMEKFEIDKKKGDYESYDTKSPSVLSTKQTEMLASAALKFTIPLDKETKAERKKVSDTERFAYGAVNKGDEWNMLDPHNPPMQEQTAWYVVNRGWIVWRFLMRQDGDEIIPDWAAWDMRNVYWGLGKRGLGWACNLRYASEEQIESEWNLKPEADKKGRVLVYDHWGKEFERVVIGNEIKHQVEHKQDRVPVLILPVGSMPFVQMEDNDETLKYMGDSCFVNNRHLYPKQSELLSYYFTVIATGTRVPTVVYYKGPTPPEFESNPYLKGSTIFLSVDKGEKVEEFFKPTMPQDAAAAVSWVNSEISIGCLSPIMSGEINQQIPTSGMALLIHAGMGVLKPRIKAMERAYTWLVNEAVRQYKNNEEFADLKLDGFDAAGRHFTLNVNKDKLYDDRRLMAKIKPEMPQEQLQEAGIATQLVEAGLMSPETAMDRYLHIQDTDLEVMKIARAKAENMEPIVLRKAAAAFIHDKQLGLAQIFIDEIRARAAQGQGGGGRPGGGQQPKGVASQPGVPKGTIPSSLVRGGVPEDVKRKMQENVRLQNIGMERGR